MLLAVLLLTLSSAAAAAAEGQFWFGNGCFWHEMHLFTEKLEREGLGRGYDAVTATAGYAGATTTLSPLCYPNPNDYNNHEEYGFAEAVTIALNGTEQYEQAAKIFFADFLLIPESEPPIWTRKDVYDQGAAYRAMVGLPGGLEGDYGAILARANVNGMTLTAGAGSDPDTFLENLVYVYDSAAFPFATAESCLQYHNDNNDPPYGTEYEAVRASRLAAGTLAKSNGCPANNILDTCGTSSVTVALRHVVLGTWEQGAAAEGRNAALECLRQLPEIDAVGPDMALVEDNVDWGLTADFVCSADLKKYEASAPHKACLGLLKPLLAERRAIDFWTTTATAV